MFKNALPRGGILIGKIVLLRYSYLKAATGIDIIMVPILMVGLFSILRNTRLPIWITDNTFAVYLIHQTFLLFSIVVISVLGLRKFMGTSIVIWLMRFTFAIFMSIAIAFGVRRFFPRLANLLFGGR